MKRTIKPIEADMLLIFISIIWGSTFIIIKNVIAEMPPILFNSIRFSIASLLMLLFLIKKPLIYTKSTIKYGIILGIILFLTFTFQTIGLKYSTASVAGFLTGLYLFFVPLLSILILKKMPNLYSSVGTITALVGLYLIAVEKGLHLSNGAILLIVNAFCVGCHIIYTDKFSRGNDPMALTFFQILTLSVLSFAYSYFFEESGYKIKINAEIIFAFILTSFFATFLAFFIQTSVQKYTTPTKAAIIFSLEPASSALFGWWIGGEVLSNRQYFGALLILIAMLISEAFPSIFKKR